MLGTAGAPLQWRRTYGARVWSSLVVSSGQQQLWRGILGPLYTAVPRRHGLLMYVPTTPYEYSGCTYTAEVKCVPGRYSL